MVSSISLPFPDIDRTPTFQRYVRLAKNISKLSILRSLQYEILEKYTFHGKVLDVGGGDKAKYRKLLNCTSYSSVNIDPAIEPTWQTIPGQELPCQPDSFDTVISFNTLEHVHDARFVLEQMHKALVTGGHLLVTTPFLYPIHAHPDDFFRPTDSWYMETLKSIGFEDIEILPLAWGPATTGAACSGLPGPLKMPRQQVNLLMDFLYHSVRRLLNRNKIADTDIILKQIAVGFYVRARKKALDL